MLEQVEQFRYLGSLMSEDRYCEKDIRRGLRLQESTTKLFTYILTYLQVK